MQRTQRFARLDLSVRKFKNSRGICIAYMNYREKAVRRRNERRTRTRMQMSGNREVNKKGNA